MESNKVLIGYTTNEYGRRADFHDFLNLLIKPDNTFLLPCHERSPAKARNVLIDAAIDNGCTHILIIDDDHTFEPDALVRLLAHDKDIVSGLYFSKPYPHVPVIFDVDAEDGSCFPIYLLKGKRGLIPMVASGFGFLLIKTSIFKKLEKPYVRLGELNSEEWCDDMGFFNRVRKAGITDIWCDLDCKIGHIGSMIVVPQQSEDGTWYTGYNTAGSQILQVPQILPNNYEFKKE